MRFTFSQFILGYVSLMSLIVAGIEFTEGRFLFSLLAVSVAIPTLYCVYTIYVAQKKDKSELNFMQRAVLKLPVSLKTRGCECVVYTGGYRSNFPETRVDEIEEFVVEEKTGGQRKYTIVDEELCLCAGCGSYFHRYSEKETEKCWIDEPMPDFDDLDVISHNQYQEAKQ